MARASPSRGGSGGSCSAGGRLRRRRPHPVRQGRARRASTPRPAPTTWSSACIRELLRRNPQLPPERVDEVAIAATTQIGDQGLTIGRTAALLAGLPTDGARLRHRPDVRRRHDRRDHDGRAASPSAPTTSRSPAASSTWAATRWARASTRTRASSPRSWSTRRRWSWASTAENLHDRFPQHHQGARRRVRAWRSQEKARQGVRRRARSSPTWCRWRPAIRRAGLGPGHRRRAAAPGHHAGRGWPR